MDSNAGSGLRSRRLFSGKMEEMWRRVYPAVGISAEKSNEVEEK